MKRRDFIKNGSLAGAAILLPASGALAAVRDSVDFHSVVTGLSEYSRQVAPIARGEEVYLLASIDHLDAFLDPETRRHALPYASIHAEGNALSFTHGGTRYTVENVMPQDFYTRFSQLNETNHA